jgi:ABC-2 type transport system ATP-binding protein
MGFIGPNGAGKSTTIKAILNQIRRDAGEIRLWGLDNIRHEKEIKKRVGVVLDEAHFYGHLSLKRMKGMVASFSTTGRRRPIILRWVYGWMRTKKFPSNKSDH